MMVRGMPTYHMRAPTTSKSPKNPPRTPPMIGPRLEEAEPEPLPLLLRPGEPEGETVEFGEVVVTVTNAMEIEPFGKVV